MRGRRKERTAEEELEVEEEELSQHCSAPFVHWVRKEGRKGRRRRREEVNEKKKKAMLKRRRTETRRSPVPPCSLREEDLDVFIQSAEAATLRLVEGILEAGHLFFSSPPSFCWCQ